MFAHEKPIGSRACFFVGAVELFYQAKALLTLFANEWVCNRQTGLAEAVATKQTHIAAGFLLTITALWIAIPRTTLFSFARRVRFEQDDQFGDSLNFFLLLGCLRTCFIEPYDQVAKYRAHGFFVHLAFNTRVFCKKKDNKIKNIFFQRKRQKNAI